MYKYPYGDSQQLNLDWILAKIKELEASEASGRADLEEVSNALLSLTYNTSTAYRRYDYAFLNGKLYRCLTDTSGVFNPTAWQEALIGDDLAVLTRWINAIDAAAVVDVKFDTSGTNGKIQQKYHDQYHDVVEVDYTPVQNSKRPLSSNAGYELNGAITSLGSDDIANDSTNVSGLKVTNALDTLNGAITSLGSDDIANDSTNVSGLKVTNALDTLNGAITSLNSKVTRTVATPSIIGTKFQLISYDTTITNDFCLGSIVLKCVENFDHNNDDTTNYIQMPFTRIAYGFQPCFIRSSQWERNVISTGMVYCPTNGKINLIDCTANQYLTIIISMPVIYL